MNYLLFVLFIFECVSLFLASYMFMLGDWTTVIEREVFEDYEDYVIVSYMIAVLLGWVAAPLFVIAVIKNNSKF